MVDIPFATNILPRPPEITAPTYDWLGNLVQTYGQGLQQEYLQRNRNLFQNGIPRTPEGGLDYNTMLEQIVRAGGSAAVPEAVILGKLALGQEIARRSPAGQVPDYGETGTAEPTQRPVFPPSTAREGATPAPGQAAASKTVADAAAALKIPVEQFAPLVGKQPGDPFDINVPGDRALATAAARQYAGLQAPEATRVQQGFSQPALLPPGGVVAQAQPTVPSSGVLPPPPEGGPAPDQITLAGLRRLAVGAARERVQAEQEAKAFTAAGDDAAAKDAEARAQRAGSREQEFLRSWAERSKETPEESAARASGYRTPIQLKEAEAQLPELRKLTDAGIEANGKIGQLEEIRRLGKNVGYGAVPVVQNWLGRWGIETAGLSDIQAYQRAIDFAAPQLRPVGSGRLLQNELNAFKSALGGMLTTPAGREATVSNLEILNRHAARVGEIASDTSLTPAQRYKKIYALEPPHLNLNPEQKGGGGGAAPTGGATAKPAYKEGDSATNPQTGQRVIYRNGRWEQQL